MRRCIPIALVWLYAGAVWTEDTPPPPVVHETVSFHEVTFDVVTVDLTRADVSLYWKKDDDTPIRGLHELETYLAQDHETLLFATNAGIYSKDFTPAGLHVEKGEEIHHINLRDGGGNFHLKPNGVFYIDVKGAHVVESSAYVDLAPHPTVATQSGPLLVENDEIHPKFRESSHSVYVRSGVGVRSPETIVFALSRDPVNFHTFARLFKDALHCEDALYLDGKISRFYMPGDIDDTGPAWFVGLLAVTAKDSSG